MVVRAYTVCIGVTPECRRMESEMIRDGRVHADEADEVYHDSQDKSDFILFTCAIITCNSSRLSFNRSSLISSTDDNHLGASTTGSRPCWGT